MTDYTTVAGDLSLGESSSKELMKQDNYFAKGTSGGTGSPGSPGTWTTGGTGTTTGTGTGPTDTSTYVKLLDVKDVHRSSQENEGDKKGNKKAGRRKYVGYTTIGFND